MPFLLETLLEGGQTAWVRARGSSLQQASAKIRLQRHKLIRKQRFVACSATHTQGRVAKGMPGDKALTGASPMGAEQVTLR